MALDELLKSQYKQYQQTIQSITRNQENHRLYMDRWVHQMKTPLSVIEFTAESLDEPESSNIREETERMKFGLNRSEEHTSELQSRGHLVCRLLLEKKKTL